MRMRSENLRPKREMRPDSSMISLLLVLNSRSLRNRARAQFVGYADSPARLTGPLMPENT